jgi:hypothetical protein
MFELLPQDSIKDVWFRQGEGRIIMDLQKETTIDSLHLFSVLDVHRGPQQFSLWGLPGKKADFTGDPKASGWTFLAFEKSLDMWYSGNVVYTVIPDKGKNAKFRYLMWVSEDSWHGPQYFREVDVFEK